MAITKYHILTKYLMQRFILLQFLYLINIKRLFNKEIKFINFEASKKHVRVHSTFLLYLSSPFLKKVLYNMEEILSICVRQKITGEKWWNFHKIHTNFNCINFAQICGKFTLIDRVEFTHTFFKLSGNTRRIFTKLF